MSNILFSPLGTSDPVSHYRDGALLHICRHLQPETIYLHYSQEMVELADHDKAAFPDEDTDRFQYAIQDLYKELGLPCQIIPIKDYNMTEPHLFDPVLQRYNQLLDQIDQDRPEVGQVFLNISSGTTAMKNALVALGTLNKSGKLRTVQVEAPFKSSNPNRNKEYDFVTLVEVNEDKEYPLRDRMILNGVQAHATEIEKNIVLTEIDSYDYVSALRLVNRNPVAYSEEFRTYLAGIVAKYQLDRKQISSINKQLKNLGSKHRVHFVNEAKEYLILWNLKLKEKFELTDYIRALSPSLVHLFNIIAKQVFPELEDYQITRKKSEIVWDMQTVEKNQRLYCAMFGDYSNFNQPKRRRYVQNIDLVKLINEYGNDDDLELKRLSLELREVEEKIRNILAHQMRAFNDQEIKEITGLSSREIAKNIRYLAERTQVVNHSEWKNYQSINEELKQLL